MFSHWSMPSTPRKLCGFFVISRVVHMIEERVFPGGSHYIFNWATGGRLKPTGFAQNQIAVVVGNLAAVLLFVLMPRKWSKKKAVLLLRTCFSLAEPARHLRLGVLSLNKFGQTGQLTPYSPGLLTSAFLFLPLALGSSAHLARNQRAAIPDTAFTLKTFGSFAVSMLAFARGLILGPKLLLGNNPNTRYTFPNRGNDEQCRAE